MAVRAKGVWFAQLLEYGIGFAVAGSAANAQHQVPVALIAIAILLNVAFLKGPFSAFHVIPLSAHRITGLVVACIALACALFVPLDIAGRLTLLGAAMTQGFVSVRFAHGI